MPKRSTEGMSPAEQRALLEHLLRHRADRESTFALSHGQHALWILHRMAPESAAYNIVFAATVSSPLDVPALRRALNAVVQRHEMLRTTFEVRNEQPVYRVHPAPIEPLLEQEDARSWDQGDMERRLVEAGREPFDLQKGPLFRARVFPRAEGGSVLLLMMHHIVFDGWSHVILLRDLRSSYEAESRGAHADLPPLTHRYADFVAWQQELLAGPEGKAMWEYWQRRLTPPLPVIVLPTDLPRPKGLSFRGGTHSFHIDAALGGRLAELARAHGVTLYVVALAAFQSLLCRYSGQEDLIIGSPMVGRSQSRFDGVVGYFVNPVVLRGDLSGDPRFVDLLVRTRANVLETLKYADYPFSLVVQGLNPARDPSRTPLFQVEFNMLRQSARREPDPPGAHGRPSAKEADGLELEPLPVAQQQEGQFDLTLEVSDRGGALDATLRYSTDLFYPETIRRMEGHLQTLLRGIVSKPSARVSALPLLTEGEREAHSRWNGTGTDLPDACVHERIAERAAAVPDRVAVESGEGRLTFGELERAAERLAGVLRERGVGPGVLVGVYMERSPSMLAALLGVWKAGGAYVPLDPGFPAERLSYMVEDSGAAVLLTQAGLEASLPTQEVPAIVIDEPALALVPGVAKGSDVRKAVPDDLAYVIYTSGSTGRPKGVAITHRALLNLLLSMGREPGLAEGDVLLSVTTLSFDIAALELYLPLLVGARVYVASREDALDGRRLTELLARLGATVMQATPATWRMLIESGWDGTPGLKILCGGEALPRDLAEGLLARAGELWNVYGPTETTVWSSVERVESGEGPVSIGRPIANTQMWVLDGSLEPLPVGIPGELHIGGTGVARGYWRQPELTAEKFVADPLSGEPGRRLYRTGDLARWLPDGRLECLGRIDHQVKVRGFRIELGEIESQLRDLPRVREAVVLAQEATGGDRTLRAYVVLGDGASVAVATLRDHVRMRLPAYMVPSSFVFLEALPRTPNGKVDRKALLKLSGEGEVHRTESVAPRTATEQTVARIWREALSLSAPLGVDDNFFDLGGHSFSAARTITALRSTFGVDLGLRSLFERPTVAGLSEAVDLLLLSRDLAKPESATADLEEFEF